LDGLIRGLAARNPLVRASDRIEAAALLVVHIAVIFAIPVACAVGTSVYDSRIHTFAAERITIQQIETTATRESSVTRLPYDSSNLTPLRWVFAGTPHTAVVDTPAYMKVGDRTTIWVNEAGERPHQPLTDNDAAFAAVTAAASLWIAMAAAGAAAWALLRLRLNHARYAAWDRALDDLATTMVGPTVMRSPYQPQRHAPSLIPTNLLPDNLTKKPHFAAFRLRGKLNEGNGLSRPGALFLARDRGFYRVPADNGARIGDSGGGAGGVSDRGGDCARVASAYAGRRPAPRRRRRVEDGQLAGNRDNRRCPRHIPGRVEGEGQGHHGLSLRESQRSSALLCRAGFGSGPSQCDF
jgi:hypothetical protein